MLQVWRLNILLTQLLIFIIGPIEVTEGAEVEPLKVELPNWAKEGLKNAPPAFGFDAYSPDSIPKWAKKGSTPFTSICMFLKKIEISFNS